MKMHIHWILSGLFGLLLLGSGGWVCAGNGTIGNEARTVAQYNYIIHILAMLLIGFGFLKK